LPKRHKEIPENNTVTKSREVTLLAASDQEDKKLLFQMDISKLNTYDPGIKPAKLIFYNFTFYSLQKYSQNNT